MIHVKHLVKEFRRPERVNGRLGAVRTLLTQKYTTIQAVSDVTFDIDAGEAVGYLGPNGAGKSTTIKMLTGILVPTSGTVSVGGLIPWKDRKANAKQIGVVFGQRSQLWWDLPLRDSFRLIGSLYGMSNNEYGRRQSQFVELLDMADFLDTPVRQLSLGQRMRGDLAAAMLYTPPVLYLDEPTVGLDVVAKESIRTFISELRGTNGTTVVLTTHDMEDVARICERLIIIDDGRVLYDGDLNTLKRSYATDYEIVFTTDNSTSAATRCRDIQSAIVVPSDANELRVRFNPSVVSASAVAAVVIETGGVSDMSINKPNLEDIIRDIYSRRAVKEDAVVVSRMHSAG